MEKISKIKCSDNEQLVIYDNKVNSQMTGLKAKDYDLFMICAYKLKDMTNQTIEVSYREIIKLAHYKHYALQDLHKYLKDEESISDIKFTFIDTDGDVHKRVLFKAFDTNWRTRKLTLKVNDEFINYFSNLQKNFTELDLIIYTSLKSKYSKILYQNICQYRNKKGCGWWDIPLDDNVRDSQMVGFRSLFDVPKAYNNKRILGDIIKPSIAEVSAYINISVEVQYGSGRGKPVTGYQFEFSPISKKVAIEKKAKANISDGQTAENADTIDYVKDRLCDVIDKAKLGIGLRSANTIIESCLKYGRDDDFLQSAIDLVLQQGAEDIGAKLNHFCINGFDKKKSVKGKAKKNSFNDFDHTQYDFEDLEKRLLNN